MLLAEESAECYPQNVTKSKPQGKLQHFFTGLTFFLTDMKAEAYLITKFKLCIKTKVTLLLGK